MDLRATAPANHYRVNSRQHFILTAKEGSLEIDGNQ
jgi:hypothetical protein